jgi:hypothetical protein
MRTWLNAALPTITPQSKLGEALAYLHKYWPRMIRYVEHGDLPIDNNPCENAIRPFVIGRKNWLFSDSQAGVHASALIYSLIETAKANGQEPSLWLTEVLSELPYAQTADDYNRLLPWNIRPKDLAINPKPLVAWGLWIAYSETARYPQGGLCALRLRTPGPRA